MRTAGSLRQSSKPDARARVKGSRANGSGRIRAAGNDGSSFGNWRGVCRHEADFEPGLPDWWPE